MTDDPRPAHFDPPLDAWILSQYADVSAALREPRLCVAGEREESGPSPSGSPAHVVAALRDVAERTAAARAAALPIGVPVDLVATFATPWTLGLAVAATGAEPTDAPRLASLAREIFLDAASATGPRVSPAAQRAILALASALPHGGEHAAMHVQTFVALSQTLACTLAGAWLALLAHPDAARRLRDEPALLPSAVEELLRHGGPSRAVFRQARADVTIGAAAMRAGDRVVLRLAAANRDPTRFADPDRLDLDRGGAGHLALGRGPHSCWGAPVIRLAVAAATGALLRTTSALDADGAPTWIGGYAIHAPATLPVILRRAL